MVSDDVFRDEMHVTAQVLTAWSQRYADVADIVIESSEHAWRMAVAPHAPQACPFEMMVRTDQRLDLAIGGELFEDRPASNLDILLLLAKSIASGSVIQRTIMTAATGVPQRLETIVPLEGGEVWREERALTSARMPEGTDLAFEDRTFVPYLSGVAGARTAPSKPVRS